MVTRRYRTHGDCGCVYDGEDGGCGVVGGRRSYAGGGKPDMEKKMCFCCCSAAGYIHSLGLTCIIMGIIRLVFFYFSDIEKTMKNWVSNGSSEIVVGILCIIVVCIKCRVIFIIFSFLAAVLSFHECFVVFFARNQLMEDLKSKKVPLMMNAATGPVIVIVLFFASYAAFVVGMSRKEEKEEKTNSERSQNSVNTSLQSSARSKSTSKSISKKQKKSSKRKKSGTDSTATYSDTDSSIIMRV